jgi:hypothetical protein
MGTIYHRSLKRCYINEKVDLSSSKKIRRLSLEYKNKVEYYCQVYLRLFPATYKCTLDVIVKSTNDIFNDVDLILLGKTRIGKVIKPGRIFDDKKKLNKNFSLVL